MKEDKYVSDVMKQNSELQKQVDELTDKLGKVLSGIKADELLVAKGIEQAVKDTVKEIYGLAVDYYDGNEAFDLFLQSVKERYGVGVEE